MEDFELDPLVYDIQPPIQQEAPKNWYDGLTMVTSNNSSLKKNKISKDNYIPQNGDIVEIDSIKNKKYGHTATYYNGKWYSDFEQKEMNPYNDKNAKIRIFRNNDSRLATMAAAITASRAGKKSSHKCAKAVREGLNIASGGLYNAQGYNGNNFGTYLQNKGDWVQVAQQGMKFAEYTPTYFNEVPTYVPELEVQLQDIIKVPTKATKEVPKSLKIIENTPWFESLTLLTVYNKNNPIYKAQSFNTGRPDNDEFITNSYQTYRQLGLSHNQALVMASQDALESNYGKQTSGKNNYSGIKGKGTKRTTHEEVNGKLVKSLQSFADYDSYKDSALHKVNLLRGKRYNAFADDNADQIISRIVKGGYATDSKYANKLLSIYKRYNDYGLV